MTRSAIRPRSASVAPGLPATASAGAHGPVPALGAQGARASGALAEPTPFRAPSKKVRDRGFVVGPRPSRGGRAPPPPIFPPPPAAGRAPPPPPPPTPSNY